MNIQASIVFQQLYEAIQSGKFRVIALQGGSRSTKTYSVCQYHFITMMRGANQIMSVVRKQFATLRRSAMRDFEEIAKNSGVYPKINHNKTQNIYSYKNCQIEFFGCDDVEKLHGPGRDTLYINEVDQLTLDDWVQLTMRTKGLIIVDFNPKMPQTHWVWKYIIDSPGTLLLKSTYRDNPFLPQAQIERIEGTKNIDPFYYQVYGLGERGLAPEIVFNNWRTIPVIPKGDKVIYGMDYGFNDPSTLMRLTIIDNSKLYIEQIIYRSGMTNTEFKNLAKNIIGYVPSEPAYGDTAEPDRIQEFKQAGWNIKPAEKGINSVKYGLDLIKKFEVFIHENAKETIAEFEGYVYKRDKNGEMTDEPIGINDHAIAAIRYGLYSNSVGTTYSRPAVSRR